MQRLRISTPADGHALRVHGQDVRAARDQIAAILQSRLGRNHADLLAVPASSADGSTTWSTALEGPVVLASDLAPDDAAALIQRYQRIVNDIRGLAGQLAAEGGPGAFAAALLSAAISVPPGSWLYSVGGRPVIVMWGHAGEPPLADAGPPTGARVVTPAPVAATPASAAVTQPVWPASSQDERRWAPMVGMAALAAAAIAALWFMIPRADGPREPSLSRVEDENRLLEEEIERKRRVQPQFACVIDVPPEPEPAASQPPVAQAVPQHEPEPEPPVAAPAPTQPPPKVPPKELRKPAPPPPPKPAPAPAPVAPPAPAAPPVARAPAPPDPPVACKPRGAGDAPEVIVIVDASGSMNEAFPGASTRLDAAKSASGHMIRSLPGDVDVGLVDFDACDRVRRDRFYSSPERGALIGEIGRLSPREGTPLAQAISRAGAIASRTADSVLVVVTDGDDSCGGDPCAAARRVKQSRPDVTINVVDLSTTPQDRRVLQCVAEAGGGAVLRPGDALDLDRKLKQAAGTAICP